MKNKRLLTLLLSFLLIFSVLFASCDFDDIDDEDEQESEGNPSDDKVVTDNAVYGTGLAEEKTSVKLDENPNRSIHRGIVKVTFKPGTMLDGTPLDESFYLYRSRLKGNAKKAYDTIRNGLISAKHTIQMTVPIHSDDIFAIYRMVIYDDPELFYVETSADWSVNNSRIVTSLDPQYNDLVNDIDGYRARIEETSKNALAALWNMQTEIEKVKYAHDYLTHINDYELGCPYNQSGYSALVLNRTVCAGYSHAFQYLMMKNGIKAAYITGDAGGPHAWNTVMLDNETYGMDVTWDDPIGSRPDEYSYRFFNVTDRHLQNNKHRRGDVSSLLPAANATKYSYENAFGGNSNAPDFGNNGGQLPDVQPEQTTHDNNWWENTDDRNGWWNVLDSSWKKNDWHKGESGKWEIHDKETDCTYLYDEFTNNFYALESNTDDIYIWSDEDEGWVIVGSNNGGESKWNEFDRKRRELQNMRNKTAIAANKLLSSGGSLDQNFVEWVNGESKTYVESLFEIQPNQYNDSQLADAISDINEQINYYSGAFNDIQQAVNNGGSSQNQQVSAQTWQLFEMRRTELINLYYQADEVIDVYAQYIQVTQDWWTYIKSTLLNYVNQISLVSQANLTEQDAVNMINDIQNTYANVAQQVQNMIDSLAQIGIYFED